MFNVAKLEFVDGRAVTPFGVYNVTPARTGEGFDGSLHLIGSVPLIGETVVYIHWVKSNAASELDAESALRADFGHRLEALVPFFPELDALQVELDAHTRYIEELERYLQSFCAAAGIVLERMAVFSAERQDGFRDAKTEADLGRRGFEPAEVTE